MFLKISLIMLVSSIFMLSQVNAFGLNKDWPITFEYWSSTIVNTIQNPECVYFTKGEMFACGSSSSNLVSCQAEFNFTGLNETLFNSFGVGLDTTVNVEITANETYFLYPRILDYTDYMSYWVTLHGKQSLFALYHNPGYQFYGVRVRDEACFNRMINYFVQNKKQAKTVNLLSYSTDPFKANILANLYVV